MWEFEGQGHKLSAYNRWIHKNMVCEVFNWFTKACFKYKIQLICTTHSLEVIDAMINNTYDSDP